ncbi:rhodanese-like domain-containing protein [Desulfovibrio inopinatus]|uniref:rhodanese-like domain-containing protein n=1 Tax=Desulfovibrio inopinatus TaxID=102109 RepID=UPI0004166FEE|nr:rhodanese-like domain-containing protein [Desulfovibrio inopinatus]
MEEQIRFYEAKLAYEMDSADLVEILKGKDSVVVIDTRQGEAYHTEHIPGSISFPHRTMDAISTQNLDRNCVYVTYCDGIGCNASTKGALKLARLGFRVKELIGGLDWWKRDGYTTDGTHSTKEGEDRRCAC